MYRLPFAHALAATALLAVVAAPALAQDQPYDDDAVAAYEAVMQRMHEAMGEITYSGDADIDFARGMIPHHVAAIEMAEIVLEHGSAPEIRTLAEAIIEAQKAEIAELEAWLDNFDTAAGDPAVGHGHGRAHDHADEQDADTD